MKITIHVTQEDIDNGLYSSCMSCPVALALNRAIPMGPSWLAVGDFARRNTVEYKFFELPIEVTHFIAAFDARSKVSPFSFEFEYEDSNV